VRRPACCDATAHRGHPLCSPSRRAELIASQAPGLRSHERIPRLDPLANAAIGWPGGRATFRPQAACDHPDGILLRRAKASTCPRPPLAKTCGRAWNTARVRRPCDRAIHAYNCPCTPHPRDANANHRKRRLCLAHLVRNTGQEKNPCSGKSLPAPALVRK